MKNLLYKLLNYIRTMADENNNNDTGSTLGAENDIPNIPEPPKAENPPANEQAENTPAFPTIEKEIALKTPEQILNEINREIMAKEVETPPAAEPKKKGKGENTPEKDGGKPDNTLLIIGIAAVLIAIGLFLWLNYQKKMKALDETNANTDNQKQPVANGYDEREYYNN